MGTNVETTYTLKKQLPPQTDTNTVCVQLLAR